MIIKIKGSTTLQEIIQAFTRHYPYLQLGFYRPEVYARPFEKRIKDIDVPIVESGTIIKDDEVECHYWHSTAWVEKQFSEKTGLNVQVLRKYKDQWIRTDGSDLLTLEEQNELGMKDAAASFGCNGFHKLKSI